jgi:cysteine desulfurase
MIHLDSHVVAKPRSSVLKALEDKWGLLDAPHRKGIELYPEVDEALKLISKCLDAESYQFHVTPGGFHAMQHLLMHFYLEEVRQTGRNHFVSSVIEEAPILKALDRMEMMGCGVKLLPVDSNGRIDLRALEESIRSKTSLISISAVCAMTGVMQPIQEIVRICHAKAVKVHVNASHAIGTWGVSLKEWNVDYLTFDGDKIGTPQGMGGLFSKESIKDSLFGVIPLARALKEITEKQEAFAMESARLRAEFEQEIVRVVPDCQILGQEVERVPHIFALLFPKLMNEALLYDLYRQKIEASIGGGQFQTLTTILQKCGRNEEGAISFALHDAIQEDDLASVLDVLTSSVRKLKKMSAAL